MLVTTQLGIRYIWIDSLCIVQDDAQDWAGEASRMASVYANAHLTISAMEATDGHQGLFINTGSEPILRRSVHEIKLPGLQYPIYVRSTEGPDPLKLTNMPLLHRGWAFQERILSPWILHFTESELNFEDARGGSFCECKELDHCIDGNYGRHWLFGTRTSYLDGTSWYHIVERYASGLLTSEADRLPALSGVATTFQRQFPALGSYLAGIWEADIVRGLHWYAYGTVRPRLLPTLARGTLLSAPPTWSWASVVSTRLSWDSDLKDYPLVEITSATCFPLTPDDKGMVAGGRITLRGRLCLATLDLSPHSLTTNMGRGSITLDDESLVSNEPPKFFPDVRLCSGVEALTAVYFLPLSLRGFGYRRWHFFGLVLCRETKEVTATNRVEHSSKDMATFSRVGVAFFETESKVPDALAGRHRACPMTTMDAHDDATARFAEWRNTVFNKFGQEQILTIV
ncbi:heterokaryon incompatibility protein [Colletotrichum camelliae]|nr:heterokaryon incompatibility protein [Colletotrichum camelliae]